MRDIMRAGHRLSVAAPDIQFELQRDLELKNISVFETPLRRNTIGVLSDLLYQWSLYNLFRKTKPDVVLTYTIKPNIWGAFAAQMAGIASVSMVTGLGYAFTDSGVQSWRSQIIRKAAASLYRLAIDRNKLALFQNPDDVRDFFALGTLRNTDKVRIINGSGVDLTHFSPVSLADQPIFLMISRLLKNKGVREYAHAARLIKQTHPKSRCLLVGPHDRGPDGINSAELAKWQGEGLEYLGAMDDVRPAIAGCRFFVLPSYREGTPRSVLEAMAMGRPIITTDAPGCRETVEGGRNGYLVPVRDATALAQRMRYLVDHPEIAEPMGAASLGLAREKYEVGSVNRDIITYLEEAAADARS